MGQPARARIGLLALALAGACGGSCGGAGEPAGPRPRLVVLLATCTLGRNVLQPYDESVCWTPNLAALAREGVVLERHETEAGQSGCDFASIFTGTQADRHGIYHHPTELAPESTTIAEAFAADGWETYFWWGHPMASPELGYAQGVEPARQLRFETNDPHSLTEGDPRFDELLARLAAEPELRAFVQVDFTVTHVPYPVGRNPRARAALRELCPSGSPELPEQEFQELMELFESHMRELQWDFDATVAELGLRPQRVERMARALELAYRASVQQLDAYVGAVLSNLQRAGVLDDTLFAFTADHGEVLHRDGLDFHWTHGLQLAPECLGVPFVVRAPGLAPGRHVGVTRSIDVFPTIAGLAGVPVPSGAVDGRDLSRALRGEEPPPELVALSHTTTLIPSLEEESREWSRFRLFYPRTDPELVWVRARAGDLVYKLRPVEGGSFGLQVFDLASDPAEARDLARSADPRVEPRLEEMRALLEDYKRRLVEGFGRARLDERAGDEALERLRGLGYAR